MKKIGNITQNLDIYTYFIRASTHPMSVDLNPRELQLHKECVCTFNNSESVRVKPP